MDKKTTSVKKQTGRIDAAAVNENTNNTTATETEATETEATETEATETEATEPDTLCTIGDTPIKIGDVIRLYADTANGTARLEVNPTDNTRNPDKPNGWRADTREAYKTLQKACKGLKVEVSYTDDRRAVHTIRATINGCGMDGTNDRATFRLTNGSVIAAGYCFTVLGLDTDYAHANRATDTADTDNRPAALIRADIADTDKRIERLQAKRETLQKSLTRALETDLNAVRSIRELHPTDRATLELVLSVPTADRIPADRLEALRAVEGIPAAAAAVRALIADAYSDEALQLVENFTPEQIANADHIAAVMAERGLKLGDIPTDILP